MKSNALSFIRLGDIADFRNGLNFSKESHGKGCPLIGVGDFKDNFSPKWDELEEINPDGVSKVEDYLKEGDLLFVRSNGNKALVGRSLYINKDIKALYSGFCIRARLKTDDICPLFLAYFTKTQFFRDAISFVAGTNINNLNQGILSEVRIPSYSKEKQALIVKALSSIDKKIELNNRINSELEAMAKTLYDYWFVQFDFPDANGNPYKASGGKMVYNDILKREIPDGWDLVPLEYFADVIDPHPSHRAPKEVEHGFPFAGIGDIDESGNIAISKARKIDEEFVDKQERDYAIGDYSLGYGRVGTVGKVVRLKKQKFRYALSPTLSVINPKKPEYAGYIYTVIKSEEFYKNVLKNTSGTTRPAIGIQLLRKIPILKPRNEHADMFERYEKITRELFEKTSIVNQESQELIELRDWLLPMLMNGQVTVKPKTESQEALHG
ncbi:restriction endonuclease subunit S [Vibrio parahaemolyticus]|nr:restriction endonuclease subunit S [Vibrio parahaemolyticus]